MEITEADIAETRAALAVVKAELSTAHPQLVEIVKSTSALQKIWEGFKHYAGIAGDAFAKSFGDSAGKAAGALVVGAIGAAGLTYFRLFGGLIHTILAWLTWVTLPF
jgi:hypothetical protein